MQPDRHRWWSGVVAVLLGTAVMTAGAPGAGAQTFACGPVPAPVPDDDQVGVTLACPVSGLAAGVGSVQVSIRMSPAHTFLGDLEVDLSPPGVSPGNPGSFLLFNGFDGNAPDAAMAGPYTFTDTATTNFLAVEVDTSAGTVPIPAGAYRTAVSSLEVTSLNEGLGGLSAALANGTWRLRVRDLAPEDVGTVASASLTIGGPTIAASILPTSRSVQAPDAIASAFATIANVASAPATSCRISPRTAVFGNFTYQTTDAQNRLAGTANEPATIPAGGSQSFFFAVQPFGDFGPADVQLNFVCNESAAAIVTGLTTLLLVASTDPVPDIVALAATAGNTGIVDVSGVGGAFAVATSNVGAAGDITVSADTGAAALPVTLNVCQTDAGGACLVPPTPTVTVAVGANATGTFSIFAQGQGTPIAFDPAANRVFVRFKDAGAVVRGATSVAIHTVPLRQPPPSPPPPEPVTRR